MMRLLSILAVLLTLVCSPASGQQKKASAGVRTSAAVAAIVQPVTVQTLQDRRELLDFAKEKALAGLYDPALEALLKIVRTTESFDAVCANALVLYHNVSDVLGHVQERDNAVMLLETCISSDPVLKARFQDALLNLKLRDRYGATSFHERLTGLWVCPKMESDDEGPAYCMMIRPDGSGTLRATVFCTDQCYVEATYDIVVNDTTATAMIYAGESIFRRGDKGIVSGAAVQALSQTADDLHDAIALQNSNNPASLENIAGQLGVSVATALLQGLVSRLAVSKTKTSSYAFEVSEIVPGILDVMIQKYLFTFKSDGESKCEASAGHVRMYKVSPHTGEDAIREVEFSPYSLKFFHRMDSGIEWVVGGFDESGVPFIDTHVMSLSKPYLPSSSHIKKAYNTINTLFAEALCKEHRSLLGDSYDFIMGRDFGHASHPLARIDSSVDIDREEVIASNTVDYALRFYKMGDYENAIPEFEKLYSERRFMGGLLFPYLAMCRYELGEEGALAMCREGLSLYPDLYEANYTMALLNIRHGIFDQSTFDMLQKCRVKDPKDVTLMLLSGDWYAANSRADEADDAYRECSGSVFKFPDNMEGYYRSGMLLLERASALRKQEKSDGLTMKQSHVTEYLLKAASDLSKYFMFTKDRNCKLIIAANLVNTYRFLITQDPSKSSKWGGSLKKYENYLSKRSKGMDMDDE